MGAEPALEGLQRAQRHHMALLALRQELLAQLDACLRVSYLDIRRRTALVAASRTSKRPVRGLSRRPASPDRASSLVARLTEATDALRQHTRQLSAKQQRQNGEAAAGGSPRHARAAPTCACASAGATSPRHAPLVVGAPSTTAPSDRPASGGPRPAPPPGGRPARWARPRSAPCSGPAAAELSRDAVDAAKCCYVAAGLGGAPAVSTSARGAQSAAAAAAPMVLTGARAGGGAPHVSHAEVALRAPPPPPAWASAVDRAVHDDPTFSPVALADADDAAGAVDSRLRVMASRPDAAAEQLRAIHATWLVDDGPDTWLPSRAALAAGAVGASLTGPPGTDGAAARLIESAGLPAAFRLAADSGESAVEPAQT